MDMSRKVPQAFNLPSRIYGQVDRRLAQLGKALPAHVLSVNNSIVEVAFDTTGVYANLPNVTIPIFGPEYIRYPIQQNCKGVVFSCDVRIGISSGLGNQIYDFTQPGNLTSLVFMPISNTAWSATPDPNSVVIYGPDGVIIQNTAGTSKIKITNSAITITVGGKTWTFNSSGLTDSLGVILDTHQHPYNAGTTPSTTGTPVA